MSRDDAIYKLIKLALLTLGRLPKSLLSFIARSLGLIWYHIDAYRRKVVMENIQAAFPNEFSHENAARFVRKNFMHTIGIALHMAQVPLLFRVLSCAKRGGIL